MKKITMIKMQGCPYCAKAAEAIEELRAEQPAYAGIEVEIIDENEQPELAKGVCPGLLLRAEPLHRGPQGLRGAAG